MTRAAIVVQRYGDGIVGGAESLCQQVAEKLVGECGWSITVYTTRAVDYVSWRNEMPVFNEHCRGVKVRRFSVLFPRSLWLFGFFNHKITPLLLKWSKRGKFLRRLAYQLEKIWIILQGPFCPGLVKALKQDAKAYDKIFFFTYLYYPSIFGAKALKDKTFALIPTAHDEPPFYFQHSAELLRSSAAVLVNIKPEQQLIEARLGHPLSTIRTAGLGFTLKAELDDAHVFLPPCEGPYILYLGRQCKAKGVETLIEDFRAYLSLNPSSRLNLVLVGKKDAGFSWSSHDRIHDLGFVDDRQKFLLIKASLCVVNPSSMESLSMIAIEAMVCKKPLLLNRDSEVLDYYCEQNTSCYGYRGSADFCAKLAEIQAVNWEQSHQIDQLESTKNWAEGNFSWSSVLKVYEGVVCELGCQP